MIIATVNGAGGPQTMKEGPTRNRFPGTLPPILTAYTSPTQVTQTGTDEQLIIDRFLDPFNIRPIGIVIEPAGRWRLSICIVLQQGQKK